MISQAPTADSATLYRQAAFFLVAGQVRQAVGICSRLKELDPNFDSFAEFANLLTWMRPKDRLYPLVHALVDAGGGSALALDLLASAATWAGDAAAARALVDPARFLSTVTVHGADDGDLPLLDEELGRDLVRYDRPEDRTIRMGWRRNHLEKVDSPVLRRMFGRLARVTKDYLDRLTLDNAHPFAKARPPRLRMKAWGVVSGAETHHLSHLHSTSWVNGVYYVKVPEAVSDAVNKPGWLRVGPDRARGFTTENGWDERWIQPQPGMVVLMPSHFMHETVPLGCDERRICVAFELHAAAPGEEDPLLSQCSFDADGWAP